MRVTVVQMNSRDDKAANLERARTLLERAIARERPDLVALPETFTFLGGSREAKFAAAETFPDGEAYGMLREIARRHGLFVHGGSMIERTVDGLYNTTVVFDRDGREIARYRKIHLFDVVTPDGRAYRESDVFCRGREVVSVEVEGVRLGLSICYDLRFGELYLRLAEAGAEVLLVPAAFTLQTGKDHWEILLRARAIETQCYVLAPAQWGPYPTAGETRWNYGHAMIVGPWGHVLAQVPDGEGFATAELDFAALRRIRRELPVAAHRVAELRVPASL
ncbi:2-oxoglutaramate amidase [bacterium HR40]|nr:2-oxoglutaramate amidase [bacterium HR40]